MIRPNIFHFGDEGTEMQDEVRNTSNQLTSQSQSQNRGPGLVQSCFHLCAHPSNQSFIPLMIYENKPHSPTPSEQNLIKPDEAPTITNQIYTPHPIQTHCSPWNKVVTVVCSFLLSRPDPGVKCRVCSRWALNPYCQKSVILLFWHHLIFFVFFVFMFHGSLSGRNKERDTNTH